MGSTLGSVAACVAGRASSRAGAFSVFGAASVRAAGRASSRTAGVSVFGFDSACVAGLGSSRTGAFSVFDSVSVREAGFVAVRAVVLDSADLDSAVLDSVFGAVSLRVPVSVRAEVWLVDRAGVFVSALDSDSVRDSGFVAVRAVVLDPAVLDSVFGAVSLRFSVSVRAAVGLVERSGVVVSVFRVVSVRAAVFDSVPDVAPSREEGAAAFVDAFDPAGGATFAAARGRAATSVLGLPPFALAYDVLSARAAATCCV